MIVWVPKTRPGLLSGADQQSSIRRAGRRRDLGRVRVVVTGARYEKRSSASARRDASVITAGLRIIAR